MLVVYTGPIDAVEFEHKGKWVVAERDGDPVDVDLETGANLIAQGWKEAKPNPAPRAKATKNGDNS